MKSYRQRKSFFRLFNFAHDDIRCTPSRDDRRMFPAFTIVELLVVIAVIAILAAITIITYVGVTSNARKSTLTANLEQASKALSVYKETTSTDGTYPDSLADAKLSLTSDSNITYSYHTNSDKTNYCLEGTTQNITKSIAGNNPTVSDSTCVSATNLITNGDFSQGTSGWGINYLAVITASDNMGISLATAQYGGIAQYYNNYSALKGHIVYSSAWLKTSDHTNVYMVFLNDGTAQQMVYVPTNNKFSHASARATISSSATVIYNKIQDGRTSDWSNSYLKNVLMIDLTSTFGSGKEPTAAQMDTMLQNHPNSWFNGTDFLQEPAQ